MHDQQVADLSLTSEQRRQASMQRMRDQDARINAPHTRVTLSDQPPRFGASGSRAAGNVAAPSSGPSTATDPAASSTTRRRGPARPFSESGTPELLYLITITSDSRLSVPPAPVPRHAGAPRVPSTVLAHFYIIPYMVNVSTIHSRFRLLTPYSQPSGSSHAVAMQEDIPPTLEWETWQLPAVHERLESAGLKFDVTLSCTGSVWEAVSNAFVEHCSMQQITYSTHPSMDALIALRDPATAPFLIVAFTKARGASERLRWSYPRCHCIAGVY